MNPNPATPTFSKSESKDDSRHYVQLDFKRKLAAWVLLGLAWVARLIVRNPAPLTKTKTFFVFEPFGMGDIISLRPAISALSSGGNRVVLAGKPTWSDAVSDIPGVSWCPIVPSWTGYETETKYGSLGQIAREFLRCRQVILEEARGAVALDPRGDPRTIFLLSLCGCQMIHSLDRYLGSSVKILPFGLPLATTNPTMKRWEMVAAMLPQLGISEHIESPQYPRSPGVLPQKIIGFVTVAPWRGKLWSPDKWEALADALTSTGWTCINFCGPGQSSLATAQAPRVPVAEVGSFSEWSKELQKVAALVTLDSGPMHLADALGVPLVVLMGATALPLWQPSRPTSRTLHHQDAAGFSPLLQNEANELPASQWVCKISTSEVLSELRSLLPEITDGSAGNTR